MLHQLSIVLDTSQVHELKLQLKMQRCDEFLNTPIDRWSLQRRRRVLCKIQRRQNLARSARCNQQLILSNHVLPLFDKTNHKPLGRLLCCQDFGASDRRRRRWRQSSWQLFQLPVHEKPLPLWFVLESVLNHHELNWHLPHLF